MNLSSSIRFQPSMPWIAGNHHISGVKHLFSVSVQILAFVNFIDLHYSLQASFVGFSRHHHNDLTCWVGYGSSSSSSSLSSSLSSLGPGRPSAGGPRMDRRPVTSLGVVKISCLALRLRSSARRFIQSLNRKFRWELILMIGSKM